MKGVDLLVLSSPTCCWHNLVENYELVCVNNQELLSLRTKIGLLGVDICNSFPLFGLPLKLGILVLKSPKAKCWHMWDL